MKKKEEICIIVDSREQLPYEYTNSVRERLPTGDYSAKGYESEIVIERKTKNDIYGSLGKGRERFEQECERMLTYKYRAIIIESDLDTLLQPPLNTKMNPKVIINTLISWSIKYDIHVYFCSNRRLGRAMVLRILEQYVRHNPKDVTQKELQFN